MLGLVKSIAIKVFGKKLRGKADLFAQDTLAVSHRLKKAFLVDYFLDNENNWTQFTSLLRQTDVAPLMALRVVMVSETLVFLVHVAEVVLPERYERLFIDISSDLKIPKVYEGPIGQLLELARASLANLLSAEGSPVVHLEPIRGLSTVGLSGWLLGYAVVYVLEEEAGGNCLGGIPLARTEVSAVLSETGTPVVLASFTCPQQLEALARSAVAGYLADLSGRLESPTAFRSIQTKTSLLTLDRVIV